MSVQLIDKCPDVAGINNGIRELRKDKSKLSFDSSTNHSLKSSHQETAPMLDAHLSYVDNVFIQLENPERNCGVSSIISVEGDVQPDTMLALLERLCKEQPKFRMRYTITNLVGHNEKSKSLACSWTAKDNFFVTQLNANYASSSIDPIGDEANEHQLIEDKLSRFIAEPFNANLPLWRLLLIRNVSNNRSIIGLVAHHCMADGQGFAHALISLMSNGNSQTASPTLKQSSATLSTLNTEPLLQENKESYPIDYWTQCTAAIVHFSAIIYSQLSHALLLFGYFLLELWYSTIMLLRQICFSRHSFRYYQAEMRPKRVAWSKAISMDNIKLIRTANPGATLNDIILAYLLDQNTDDQVVRNHYRDTLLNLIIPIGFRAPNDNRFENLASNAHKHMSRVKLTKIALGLKLLASVLTKLRISYLPSAYIGKAVLNRHGILTNIPGPTTPLYIGDKNEQHKVISYALYPPAIGNGAVSMGISSYNGNVVFSALADDAPEYPDQARQLVDGVYKAFEIMLADSRSLLELQ
ncbi:hypothetical protein BDF19DRAFT_433582 [Syncephalis fuscata]|nr:hypothetical protein BDF19DRAFT_433582 [Syncephalis fuscata]